VGLRVRGEVGGMSTAEEREQWQTLAEAATPGPWKVSLERIVAPEKRPMPELYDAPFPVGFAHSGRDTLFIAAAREAVPALLADLEAAERERDAWRESAADLGQRLNKAEYDRDEEQYENQRLRDGIEALAYEWRYKGEFGWGPWQEGHGPEIEGQVLDEAAIRLRALLAEGGAS